MHHVFVTYGDLKGNAGYLRPLRLTHELCALGERVSFVMDDYPYNREHVELPTQAHRVFVDKPRSLASMWTRRKFLCNIPADFLHLLNPHVKSLAATMGTKHCVVAHWDEPYVLREMGFARNSLEWLLAMLLRRQAHIHISCTRHLQFILQEKWGLESTYIPHAGYLQSREDGASPFTEPTAVYMGNLYHIWDHDIVFEAARVLQSRGVSPAIRIMGDGPDMPQWRKFVAEYGLNKVTLAGFVKGDELWRSLRHAHILLFPIRDTVVNRTRCPSKIFAYAQARRPLITNRVGEVPEMLGEKAWYTDSSPQAFADAIADAMSKPSLPDVDYQIEKQNYADRTQRLLAALTQRFG